MFKGRKALNPEEQGTLLYIFAIMFGAWARLIVPLNAGFPVNDGGMFLIMIKAVQQAGYRLPDYFQYNGLVIPFVYPPLSFFIGAWLGRILQIDPLQVILWLPAFVSILSIVAFYPLARNILHSPFNSGIATLFFALTPRVITWQVMGGGLTRSFGQLFLVLSVLYGYRLFVKGSFRDLLLAIIFNSLLVLSHPESSLHAVGLNLVLLVFYGRNKHGIMNALAVGAGVILVTLPWSFTVLHRFGPAPLISASETGLEDQWAAFREFLVPFSEEPAIPIIAMFALLGMVISIAKSDYFLPILMIFPSLLEPRFAPTTATIGLALLASVGLVEAIFPAIAAAEARSKRTNYQSPMIAPANKVFSIGLLLFLLLAMYISNSELWEVKISAGEQRMLSWITSNTPDHSRFLILTGTTDLFCDPLLEWFPVLTQRVSVTTLQGREWFLGRQFVKFLTEGLTIENCANTQTPLSCIQNSAKPMGISYDYLFILRKTDIRKTCRAIKPKWQGEALILQLQNSNEFQPIYLSDDFAIYAHDPGHTPTP